MKSSCVAHPEREPLLVIRQWQVEWCLGNHCAAALLSFFEYWHNVKLDMREKALATKVVASKHGDDSFIDTTLLQFHNAENLSIGLLGLFGETKVRKSLEFLETIGAISVHRNPNPRYSFDQTKFFLFHPEKVSPSRRIDGIHPVKIPNGCGENTDSSRKNKGTRTETTTETTTEITTKTSLACDKSPQEQAVNQSPIAYVSVLTNPTSEVDVQASEVLAKFKNKPNPTHTKVTVAVLERIWKREMASAYESFVPSFTLAQKGQLKHIITRSTVDGVVMADILLGEVIPKWSAFGHRVALDTGIATSPDKPSVAYLLANIGVAVNFTRDMLAKAPQTPKKSPASPVQDLIPPNVLPEPVKEPYRASLLGKDGSIILKKHKPQPPVALLDRLPTASYTSEGYEILEFEEAGLRSVHAGMTIKEIHLEMETWV